MDSFFDIKLKSIRSGFQNKFYHISANCIKARNTDFVKSSVCIPPNITLSGEHLVYFKKFGVDLAAFCQQKIIDQILHQFFFHSDCSAITDIHAMICRCNWKTCEWISSAIAFKLAI